MGPKSKSRDGKSFCKNNPIAGYNPRVCTGKWMFYEDCTNKTYKNAAGPYEKKWRETIDTLPKSYDEIATSKICLPKLPTVASPSTKLQRNHIYTRYTQDQHRQKDAVDRIEKMVRIKWASKKNPDYNLFPSMRRHMGKHLGSGIEKVFQPFDNALSDSKSKTDDAKKDEQQIANTDELENFMDNKIKNPYRGFAKAMRLNRPGQKTATSKKKSKAKKEEDLRVEEEEDREGTSFTGLNTAAENRLNDVVQEFCDSISDLGGDEGNIDPLTINCLFTSGYDTTPAMSAPVSLVKQSELPPSLREPSGMQRGASGSGSEMKKDEPYSSKAAFEKIVQSDRNGYRYGAWYLEPGSWTRMKKDTQLQDPKTIRWEATMTDLDMKKREVTEELSTLRITKAFAEFITIRNARLPEFIVEAEKFCMEREERERQKADAEAKAKQEYLTKNKWN